MKTNTTNRPRRTVLAGIASVAIALLGGCSDSLARPSETTEQSHVFERVAVEDEDLVIELSAEAGLEQVTVIQPNGELFAKRSIAQGVTRETIRLGTTYEPGEYEVLGLEGDTTVERTSIEIRPDVRIMDVKLARNHPGKMYEGASQTAISSDVIVTVENHGIGPDAVTELRFEGDVPQPTPTNFDKSGIFDTENQFSLSTDEVLVLPTETKTLYSNSYPFSWLGGNVPCEPAPFRGEFTVRISTALSEEGSSLSRAVEYHGTSLRDCKITLVEDDS